MPGKITNKEFIQKSKLKFGDKLDYSECFYINKRTKVKLTCRDCGITFEQTPETHLRSVTGCPKCGHDQSNSARKWSTEKYVEKLKETYRDTLDFSKTVYNGNKEKVTITCPVHGDFEQRADHVLIGLGCPHCNRHLSDSQAAKNRTYYMYKENACKKGREFSLSYDEVIELVQQNCYYCGSGPSLETVSSEGWKRNGIDRIDSSKGYIPSNVVPCCSRCNFMKSTMNQPDFYGHISRIYKHLLNSNKLNND